MRTSMKKDIEGHKNLVQLAKKAKGGDQRSLAQLLSLVERDFMKAGELLSQFKGSTSSVRLGITGPPGAGKSSLINILIKNYREEGKKVAVLAVDPSSPFSGGALL